MNEAGVKKGGAGVVKIPARVESATLARFFSPGEPAVVLKLLGVGNTAPFYLQDKAARILVLKWDSRAGGHVIRIPHSLWHANEARLAHDVMEQGRLVNGMIVTFELPVEGPRGCVTRTAAPQAEASGRADAESGPGAGCTSETACSSAVSGVQPREAMQGGAMGASTATCTMTGEAAGAGAAREADDGVQDGAEGRSDAEAGSGGDDAARAVVPGDAGMRATASPAPGAGERGETVRCVAGAERREPAGAPAGRKGRRCVS